MQKINGTAIRTDRVPKLRLDHQQRLHNPVKLTLIILSPPRTGSTFVAKALSCYTAPVWNEPFHRSIAMRQKYMDEIVPESSQFACTGQSYSEWAEWIAKMERIDLYGGCKLTCEWQNRGNPNFSDFFAMTHAHHNQRIYTIRHPVAQYASLFQAIKSSTWNRSERTELKPVEVKVRRDIIEYIDYTNRMVNLMISNHPGIVIPYEELNKPQDIARRVFGFYPPKVRDVPLPKKLRPWKIEERMSESTLERLKSEFSHIPASSLQLI